MNPHMNHSPTFYILGAGAIGLSLAVHLARAHHNSNHKVQLVRTSTQNIEQQAVTISLKGLHSSELSTAQVDVCSLNYLTDSQLTEQQGVIIVTAKTFANETIAEHFKNQQIKLPIILMQNGIGIEEAFLQAGFKDVYRTILYSGGERTGEYEVEFKMVRSSPTGVIAGDKEKLNSIIEQINTAQFPFHVEDDIQKDIWKKSIANAVFNTICPLLEIDNGIFVRDTQSRNLASSIIHECIEVAKTQGVTLNHDTVLKQVLSISKGSEGQLVSTLQDIQKKQPTEIDSLNLKIASLAEASDIKTPLTKALGKLIQIKSSFYGRVLK